MYFLVQILMSITMITVDIIQAINDPYSFTVVGRSIYVSFILVLQFTIFCIPAALITSAVN